MDRRKHLALNLLNIEAFNFSLDHYFTWTSGLKSPVYTDNRKIISFPVVRDLIIEDFIAILKEKFPAVQYIAGIATGAIPYASIIADRLKLPLVYIRSKPKEHGLENQIEGKIPSDVNVVVIEDLISTGGSSINAINALEVNGVHVLGLLAIFSYNLPQAKEKFEMLEVEVETLTDFDNLITVAMQVGSITEHEAEHLYLWRNSIKI